MESFSLEKVLSVRINTLKISVSEAEKLLRDAGLVFERVPFLENAFIIKNIHREELSRMDFFEKGSFYQQNLSSMIVPTVLDPKAGEMVLDMCAAPGSKSTQMAAMMNNKGQIVCVENVRDRFFRLKSVVALLGASNIKCQFVDGRKYRNQDQLFDKVLLDAPCSTEGRFSLLHKDSVKYWSPRKIKEMQHKQRGLILNAGRLLKPGGVLVYSTCTFAPEENESVVDWFLRKADGAWQIEDVVLNDVARYPAILEWNEREFDERVKHCVRILPSQMLDGFFIAKLRKIN